MWKYRDTYLEGLQRKLGLSYKYTENLIKLCSSPHFPENHSNNDIIKVTDTIRLLVCNSNVISIVTAPAYTNRTQWKLLEQFKWKPPLRHMANYTRVVMTGKQTALLGQKQRQNTDPRNMQEKKIFFWYCRARADESQEVCGFSSPGQLNIHCHIIPCQFVWWFLWSETCLDPKTQQWLLGN